jgi:hypothetical protein
MITELEEALADVPILDIHTHLVGGKLAARGLHDVLLYHMVVSDLYAAGCPTGARLTPFPGWPSRDKADARIKEAIPYPLWPDPLDGNPSFDRHRLSTGLGRRDGPGAGSSFAGGAGRAGLLCILCQRSVLDGTGGPRR